MMKERNVFLDAAILEVSVLRIKEAEKDSGLFYYAVRHDDVGGFEAVTLEKSVLVNHMYDLITKKPILEVESSERGSIELTESEAEAIHTAYYTPSKIQI